MYINYRFLVYLTQACLSLCVFVIMNACCDVLIVGGTSCGGDIKNTCIVLIKWSRTVMF